MLSSGCGEAVRRVSGGYLHGVGMLSAGCGGFLEGVGRCLKGVGRLFGGCGEAVWRVWRNSLESVGRL